MKKILSIYLSLAMLPFIAQNKRVSVEDYFLWSTISSSEISADGSSQAYTISKLRANDTLRLMNYPDKTKFTYGRGSAASLTANGNHALFYIGNDYDSIRQLKIDKVKKSKWPSDSLGIYHLKRDTLIKMDLVSNFSLNPYEGSWAFVKRAKTFKPAVEIKPKEKKRWFSFLRFRKKKKKDDEPALKISEKNYVTLYNLENDSSELLKNVESYSISNYGNSAFYHTHYTVNDSIDSSYIWMANNFNTAKPEFKKVYGIQGWIESVTLDKKGNQIAFYATTDTSENKLYSLLHYSDLGGVKLLVDSVDTKKKPYKTINPNFNLSFSDDGRKLFFGAWNIPAPAEEDTIPQNEKYSLDLWSHTDGRLQPLQLKTQKKDQKASQTFVYHFEGNDVVAVTDTSVENITYSKTKNSDFVLLRDPGNYEKEVTWDFWYFDYYLKNLKTGEKKLLYEHYHGWNASLAPEGNYFVYFEPKDSNWYATDTRTMETKNLTGKIDDAFYNQYHDKPEKMSPEGAPEWLKGNNSVLLESHHEVWIVNLVGGKAVKLTKGKENGLKFMFLNLDKEEDIADLTKGIYLKARDLNTQDESIWKWGDNGLEKLVQTDKRIYSITKAKKSGKILWRKMTTSHYPDLEITDVTFRKSVPISNVNPQQSNYAWPTVERVNWKDYKGNDVSGLLYKPNNFSADESYPMIVYYYERYLDRKHYYYAPKPTASIIYPTEYASNGYVIFIPDISYTVGHPAKDAYNAIMSGTDHVLKKYTNIDSTRMGLQGQSWGGYQTAIMVTMTDRFKCGMAGAPVSNMFSAYGGIRWGSGYSRTFQYETGQSRIGSTIWEKPELYIENSPLFHLPKVKTPLLIMHNDNDGAVPWYQGIELFLGLRRLGKETWMLNYNGDNHNLTRTANKIDLSIRMRQFFDHYLLDSPKPKWMKEGIPATKKGTEDAYELD